MQHRARTVPGMNAFRLFADLLTPAQRRYVYAAVALLATVVTAFQVAGGDWKAAGAALLASLVAEMARQNTVDFDVPSDYAPKHRAGDDEQDADPFEG